MCPIIEGPGCCVEEHDGYQGVQHHGQHQGDQVEQGDVCEEHPNVHAGISGVSEVTLRYLRDHDNYLINPSLSYHAIALDTAVLDVGED